METSASESTPTNQDVQYFETIIIGSGFSGLLAYSINCPSMGISINVIWKHRMKFKYRNQILAVFFALALFNTGSANAGLITMDAVKYSFGDHLSFDAFDETLGTLKNVKLYYGISMWLRIVNDSGDIVADDWTAAVTVGISDVSSLGYIVDNKQYRVETFDLQENGYEVVLYSFTLDDVADVPLNKVQNGFRGLALRIHENELNAQFLATYDGDVYCAEADRCFGGNFSTARLEYQYETGARQTVTNVPEPSTLAIFALGMIGLASSYCQIWCSGPESSGDLI